MLRLTTLTDTHTNTHTHTQTHTYSVGSLWTRDRSLATQSIHKRNIHATGENRTRIASNQAAADLRLIPRSH